MAKQTKSSSDFWPRVGGCTVRLMSSKKTRKKANDDISHAIMKDDEAKQADVTCVTTNSSGNIRIVVEARPNAKSSGVSEFRPDAVGIRIAAPPRDGEANEELIRFLAEEILKVRPSLLSIDRGGKSRGKVVLVDAQTSGLTLEQVIEQLKTAAANDN
eukprot:TRINITY_DN21451_c0_g1_i2.p1 TRINITY_DN21451_c0_g1~~TRINITY_DN21451_c0_g1_i2.p1  ORF type:complete len:165 (-),score=30.38 TRINITY_DN21451_c0_g1_i2:21-494(-)